ncbi:hypothetical protein BDV12DRAFT_188558 [Aspergillus spectabilis]
MAIIPIEIVSDAICPWCFIGYRILEHAIAMYKKTYPGGSKDVFEITWKPYFIDQVEPVESVRINDRMARRMTPAQITAAQTRLQRIGKSLGIAFKFGGYIGSSRLAHRVLYLAGRISSSTQCRVSESLFKSQFELEKDVSELDVVVAAAMEGGMDENVVREFLTGDEGTEIEREAREIRDKGVKGGAGEMGELFEAIVAAKGLQVSE